MSKTMDCSSRSAIENNFEVILTRPFDGSFLLYSTGDVFAWGFCGYSYGQRLGHCWCSPPNCSHRTASRPPNLSSPQPLPRKLEVRLTNWKSNHSKSHKPGRCRCCGERRRQAGKRLATVLGTGSWLRKLSRSRLVGSSASESCVDHRKQRRVAERVRRFTRSDAQIRSYDHRCPRELLPCGKHTRMKH